MKTVFAPSLYSARKLSVAATSAASELPPTGDCLIIYCYGLCYFELGGATVTATMATGTPANLWNVLKIFRDAKTQTHIATICDVDSECSIYVATGNAR